MSLIRDMHPWCLQNQAADKAVTFVYKPLAAVLPDRSEGLCPLFREGGTMRYGDTKNRRKRKPDAFQGAVGCAYQDNGDKMAAAAAKSGPSNIWDPWVCGLDQHGLWLGDDTRVEVVGAGLTELIRIAPHRYGSRLAPPVVSGGPFRQRDKGVSWQMVTA